jgi:hypothetical protein
MSPRPQRKSATDALAKIRNVLAWESCSESSEAFQSAAARMELEFRSAKRRRTELAQRLLVTPTKKTESEEEDDEDEDVDTSDSEAYGSEPSSSDMYSDPGSSSEDDEISSASTEEIEPVLDTLA